MFSCAKDETNSFRFHSLFVPENLQLQLTMISHSSHTEIGGLSRRFLFSREVCFVWGKISDFLALHPKFEA